MTQISLAQARPFRSEPAPAVALPARWHWAWRLALAVAALAVVATLVWQGITAKGNPDPTADGVSPTAVVMDTGILVFREGLEAVIVLAALTASLARTEQGYWKPVALGAGASLLASVVTWFAVVGIIATLDASKNVSALNVQAATGLLAIVVLLVIMNWFFHKVYWTGWITHHNRRKRELTETPGTRTRSAIFRGLALIGFTSVYREGFEVVLFLQSLRLKAGSHVVLEGVAIGLGLTLIVAWLTFAAHYKLPYKRMLVLTGVLLGGVLMVMVGEQVDEMQQASWIGKTVLPIHMPEWLNVWFGIFPTVQSLAAQAAAGAFVIGSYFLARRVCRRKPATATCVLPDCENCTAAGPTA
jgi:high-affinity iron transporter